MKFVNIFLALLIACFSSQAYGKSSVQDDDDDMPTCITAERIIKPTASWKMLKTEITYQNDMPFLEVSIHNPLNKTTPESVDAKLTLALDANSPFVSQNGKLLMVVFYNNKATVTFKRIFIVKEVTVKDKTKKILVETKCFGRNVVPNITFEEDSQLPDGGTD